MSDVALVSFSDQRVFNGTVAKERVRIRQAEQETHRLRASERDARLTAKRPDHFTVTFLNGRRLDAKDMYARDCRVEAERDAALHAAAIDAGDAPRAPAREKNCAGPPGHAHDDDDVDPAKAPFCRVFPKPPKGPEMRRLAAVDAGGMHATRPKPHVSRTFREKCVSRENTRSARAAAAAAAAAARRARRSGESARRACLREFVFVLPPPHPKPSQIRAAHRPDGPARRARRGGVPRVGGRR